MSDFSANALDNRVSESCFFSCCVGKKICGFIFHTSPRLLIDTLDNTDSKKWVYLSIHGPWLYCENSATDWPLDFPADNMSDAKLGILSFKLRDAVIEGVFVRHGSSDIIVVLCSFLEKILSTLHGSLFFLMDVCITHLTVSLLIGEFWRLVNKPTKIKRDVGSVMVWNGAEL